MYTCFYDNSSKSSSECSEPLELLITDLELPKPNITLYPKKLIYLGSNVSIQCSFKEATQRPIQRFYLHTDADKMKADSVKPDGDTATFNIREVQEHHAGKYRCSYRAPSGDFISSKFSDDLELFVIDPYFPRPIISLGPTELVAFGGNVTFQCQSKKFSMRFYIQKSGEEMLQPCLGTDKTTAQCFISNVDQVHTGVYSCRYSESKPFIISKTSELVRLLMTDQNIARPNISLIPGYIAHLGSKVTIQCSAQGQSKRFYLHKAEDKKSLQIAVTNEDRKNFSINKMDWEHGGSFYCSYTEPSQFFTSSEASDRVELFVLDPKLSKPNITLAHTQWVIRGGNATINCQSQHWAAKFLFEKTGKQMPLQAIEINGTMGTFFMKDANLEDGGNYSCRYSTKEKPFIISEPSDLVTIKITDPDLPRPSISFHPSAMPQLGKNITIQCSVNNSYKACYLYKDGGKKELQSVETSSSDAVFLINNVSEADGGSYYCNYRPQSGPFISEASNTVDLYLVDPNLYIPTISMSPSNLVAFGEQVTIRERPHPGEYHSLCHRWSGHCTPWLYIDFGSAFPKGACTLGEVFGGGFTCVLHWPLPAWCVTDQTTALISPRVLSKEW
ncbi:immunoglobulin superfamily member 1-like [Podarcis lilfordi]|nr:immunoglobulin superfamily member 1-like [Podarcis lilfordi]